MQLCYRITSSDYIAFEATTEAYENLHTNEIEWWNPLALTAKVNANDNPRWHEEIYGPDKAGSWEAMKVEIRTLTKLKARKFFPLTPDVNVLNSTKALKFKRYPDGNIQKFKSRFCFRGYQQVHGIAYFNTFAPFVSWTTVRILLIPSVILGLDTNQVEYTYDFLHTQLPNDTYVFMLRGF